MKRSHLVIAISLAVLLLSALGSGSYVTIGVVRNVQAAAESRTAALEAQVIHLQAQQNYINLPGRLTYNGTELVIRDPHIYTLNDNVTGGPWNVWPETQFGPTCLNEQTSGSRYFGKPMFDTVLNELCGSGAWIPRRINCVEGNDPCEHGGLRWWCGEPTNPLSRQITAGCTISHTYSCMPSLQANCMKFTGDWSKYQCNMKDFPAGNACGFGFKSVTNTSGHFGYGIGTAINGGLIGFRDPDNLPDVCEYASIPNNMQPWTLSYDNNARAWYFVTPKDQGCQKLYVQVSPTPPAPLAALTAPGVKPTPSPLNPIQLAPPQQAPREPWPTDIPPLSPNAR